MPPFKTKPAFAIGATALVVLGATGVAASARSTDSATGTTPKSDTRGPRDGGRGMGPDSAALAKKLGVSTADLQAAVKAVRDSQAKKDFAAERTAEIAALAKALDSDAATITKAIESVRPARGDRPTGTTPDKVRPTTPPAGDHGPGHGGPGGHGGHGGPGGSGGPRGDQTALIAALAKATGKSEATVKAALTAQRTAEEAEHQAEQAAFAKALAAKLNLKEADVAAALEASRPTPPAAAAKAKKTTK